MELYKKYRPTKPSELVGQPQVVSTLKSHFKKNDLPHFVLMCGPSGCGKTTVARMAAAKLGATESDLAEINCANFRGIDMVREITQRMNYAPQNGTARAWIIDEAHQLSSAAQNAFLKILEDTPSHVWFFMCTTDANKLLPTIRNRATTLQVKGLTTANALQLVNSVCEKEDISLEEEVAEQLVELGEGSPRKLLVLLNQIRDLPTDQQIEALTSSEAQSEAIELCRLLAQPNMSWPKISEAIKSIKEEPESIRWMVLGYFTGVLLGKSKLIPKAAIILDAFSGNFYDTKKAGLALACYEVYQATK